MSGLKIIFFKSPSEFRRWLGAHHENVGELWVGLYRKSLRKTCITHSEALDEALCFGWIDGRVKSVDASSYTIRFTPRKPHSTWSRVNIRRVRQLKKQGRMAPAGLKAFAARDPQRSGAYSFENRPRNLPPAAAKEFRANSKAWDFFQAQPPGYRRTAIWWVISAKRTETQQRRLSRLIYDSAGSRRLWLLSPFMKAPSISASDVRERITAQVSRSIGEQGH